MTDIAQIPDLVDKSVRNVWIKDGKRRMMTDSGWMTANADSARKMFGNYKQGRYSIKQKR